MGSSVSPVFVQFPHPGKEHNPRRAPRQPWNTGEHRRKFLRSDGRHVDGIGSDQRRGSRILGRVGGALIRCKMLA
jgi:hypothetical protein